MSRSSVISASIIVVLILIGIIMLVVGPDRAIQFFVPSYPYADILSEEIRSSGIISLDRVDLSTARGWREDGRQPYEIIGATTKNPEDGVVGVLYIEAPDRPYDPGIYLVQLVSPGLQVGSSIVLVDVNGEPTPAINGIPMNPEQFPLPLGRKNHFVFEEGSLRCEIWFWRDPPAGLCWDC